MIQFDGIDLVSSRSIPAPLIRRGLGIALGVPAERISVIDDVAKYPHPGQANVVCVISALRGDFPLMISIQCQPMAIDVMDALGLAQQISSQLGIALLAPDQGPDPYVMWLVQASAPPVRVSLDAEAFDDNRYRVMAQNA
jgi:hypothetical protein